MTPAAASSGGVLGGLRTLYRLWRRKRITPIARRGGGTVDMIMTRSSRRSVTGRTSPIGVSTGEPTVARRSAKGPDTFDDLNASCYGCRDLKPQA